MQSTADTHYASSDQKILEQQEEKGSASVLRDGATFDLDAVADQHGFHEHRAGRLVLDPAEAEREYGPEVAKRLKLNKQGDKVLWPQPRDSPEDPQNWSDRKKLLLLVIATLAAIVPDFNSGLGIASVGALAEHFETSVDHINNLTSNWSIFLLGPGGIAAVVLVRRYGRLPVLFWSQVFGLGFLIGCACAPNLAVFAGMRCLNSFFSTAPQVIGLYTCTDLYPFHLQARALNAWTMGFIASPFLSPWLGGYIIASASWRWVYGWGCFYVGAVVLLIAFFMEETMYDRHLRSVPPRPTNGMRYRIETLIGITGVKMVKYRATWAEAIWSPLNLIWRPQLLLLLVYVGAVFGFGIGINVTNVVFLRAPPPIGYGYGQYAIASSYATPIVATILGELAGRYVNDFIADRSTKRNQGVFEAEARLWTLWIALPFFVAGFVLLGASFQNKLSPVALVFGWGMAEVAIMVSTVAVLNYASSCFPDNSGELSALINVARTLGGFAVPYFQLPWATKYGALQTFGCEAAAVTGLCFLVVPLLQVKGKMLRNTFSLAETHKR